MTFREITLSCKMRCDPFHKVGITKSCAFSFPNFHCLTLLFVAVKAVFGDETRRFELSEDKFDTLQAQAASRFSIPKPEAIRLQYKDKDVSFPRCSPSHISHVLGHIMGVTHTVTRRKIYLPRFAKMPFSHFFFLPGLLLGACWSCEEQSR